MRVVILMVVIFLSGCTATKNMYVSPQAENKNTATIVSSWTRNGVTDWEGYSIEAIDNKAVSYGLSDRDWVTFPITEGRHKLVVFGEYNRSFGGTCPCQARAELEFKAERGKHYKLVGKVEGASIKFWVINKDTQSIVSGIAKGSYKSSPHDVVVPIYM